MHAYTVVWEMDIEADSPEDAARKALKIHRNTDSIATVFTVTDEGSRYTTTIDLSPDA